MRKIIFTILSLFSFVFIFSSFTFAATTYPRPESTKTFSEIKNGKLDCASSTGLGYNTVGGAWTPMQNGAINFACDGSSGFRGNTCVFTESDFPAGYCSAGYSDSGYGGLNPYPADGGCHYNLPGRTLFPCSHVLSPYQVTILVQNSSGTALANVPIQLYDNGLESTHTSGSNGMITVSSWSGDHMKIWGVNSASYTFNHTASTPWEFEVNSDTPGSCGTQLGVPAGSAGTKPPCIIVASAGGGGGGSNGPSLTLAVKLPGIPTTNSSGQVQAPLTLTRPMHVQLFASDATVNESSTPLFDVGYNPGKVLTYDPNTGYFRSSAFDLGASVPTGNYQIFIKVQQYLRRQIVDASNNKVFTLTQGQATILPQTTLIPGDIASLFNQLDMQDYNALRDCYGSTSSSVKSSCAAGLSMADLNDDGQVDPVDINIFLIGLRMLLIDQTSTNNNGDGPLGL